MLLAIDKDLHLRSPEATDAKELFNLIDKHRLFLSKWLPWVDSTLREADTIEYLDEVRLYDKAQQTLTFLIIYKGKIAGMVDLHDIMPRIERAELGYWLGESYQGKGLMTAACKAVMDYAFEEWHLNRLMIRVVPENTRSLAIPHRLGFKLEGTLRQEYNLHGELRDLALFGLLRDERF